MHLLALIPFGQPVSRHYGKEKMKMAVKQRPGVGNTSNEKMLRLAAAVREMRIPLSQVRAKAESKLQKA